MRRSPRSKRWARCSSPRVRATRLLSTNRRLRRQVDGENGREVRLGAVGDTIPVESSAS